jgi:predicted outer membrane repeat protein
MYRLHSRSVRWTLALTMLALAACADEPTSTTSALPHRPNLVAAGDDVVVVTSTGGGTGVGTIRWAAANVKSYGVIRFDPALAGYTIALDSTIVVNPQSVTIEGPQNGGITLSGGNQMRVLHFGEQGYIWNLTITKGFHPVSGGGIYAPQGLLAQNTTVSYNSAPTGGGIYGGSVGLINSTVANNTSSASASGVSFAAPSGGISLYNSTVARNGPAPGIEARGSSGVNGLTILNNSIIAYNGVPIRNCVNFANSNLSYEGTNISDDASCGGTDKLLITDPLLGVLADNGGPSPTISLTRESPAINAGGRIQPYPGTSCLVYKDQRYVARDTYCDVGAFEFTDFTVVTIAVDADASVNATTGAATITGTVRCNRPDPIPLGVQLNQTQKTGKTSTTIVRGNAAVNVVATSVQPWSMTVALVRFVPERGAAATRSERRADLGAAGGSRQVGELVRRR